MSDTLTKTTILYSWKLIGVAGSALFLSACSDGSSSGDSPSDDDIVANIESAGRLALYGGDTSSIAMLDLDSETTLQRFALPGGDARLYASPDKRYAVAIQRDDNKVSFIDSGLYTEDHVDHLHDYMEDPVLLDFALSGSRPTHYSAHEEHGVVFFDAQDGILSTVSIMSDSDIGAGVITGELTLSNSMHGAAKFVNDHLFVTYRDTSITETVLPAAIERYVLADGVFM